MNIKDKWHLIEFHKGKKESTMLLQESSKNYELETKWWMDIWMIMTWHQICGETQLILENLWFTKTSSRKGLRSSGMSLSQLRRPLTLSPQ